MCTEYYYTQCCGKVVLEHKEYKSKNILQVGLYKGIGKYYCSRCNKSVTKTGRPKKV